MKSKRGITITSLVVYIIAMTLVVGVVSYITRYFYKNVSENSGKETNLSTYIKFNSYFTNEINVSQNSVEANETNAELSQVESYIVFSKTKNQYTFKKGKIYLNQIEICKNVESCIFTYNANDESINVTMIIDGQEFNTTYTCNKW